jgi:hypothetical protein
VLDHVPEHDRVERARLEARREQVARADVQPETLARKCRRERARLHADRGPSAFAGLVEQKADPAAQVEQPAGRAVALDPLERPARRRPLAQLLVHVVI